MCVVFNVDIFQLCWCWLQVQFDGIGSVEVCVGCILYYFQLVYDEFKCCFEKVKCVYGEMQVCCGDCSGKVLVEVLLLVKLDVDGFVILCVVLLKGMQGMGDLCINFIGDMCLVMWVLDEVMLGK